MLCVLPQWPSWSFERLNILKDVKGTSGNDDALVCPITIVFITDGHHRGHNEFIINYCIQVAMSIIITKWDQILIVLKLVLHLSKL